MKNTKIWLIDLYNKRIIKNPWIWAFVFFYIPSIVLLLPTILPIINDLNIIYINNYICMGVASIWIIFGVVLTNLYFDFVYKLFNIDSESNDKDESLDVDLDLKNLIFKYKKMQLIIAIIWCLIVIGVLIVAKDRLIEFLRINNEFAYILLLLYVGFTAYIQTYGYSCLIMTIWILISYFKKFSNDDFVDIYQLEEGVEKLSGLIFKTLFSFFSGILFFPLMYIFAQGGSVIVKLLVSAVAFIYILFLIVYLLFCCIYVKKNSQNIKDKIIDKYKMYNKRIRSELLIKFDKVDNCDENQRGKILEMIFNSNIINDINEINVNPFTNNKIYLTLTALAIPLFETFLDFKEKIEIIIGMLGL